MKKSENKRVAIFRFHVPCFVATCAKSNPHVKKCYVDVNVPFHFHSYVKKKKKKNYLSINVALTCDVAVFSHVVILVHM